MVDDVEDILREIADRVRAEQTQGRLSQTDTENLSNGVGVAAIETADPQTKTSLARVDSYLTTTGRAWDRLPPVFSHRTGAVARLERWIKGVFKRSTRWYTWEQINFNAAVHQALGDTLSVLSSLDSRLHEMLIRYEGLEKRTEQLEIELHTSRSEIRLQLRELENALKEGRRALDRQQKGFEEHHQQQLESQSAEISTQRAQLEALTAQVNSRIAELATEFRERSESLVQEQRERSDNLLHEQRERIENLLQEQRVSYKQLALEISEIGTVVERGRRDIQTRLQKLENRAS